MTETPSPGDASPPPPPPPPPARPPLRRPKQERLLAGVAVGVADHLGIDVSIVRILLVVLAVLTNGLLVLAYIVAAIVIPEADERTPTQASTRSANGSGRDPLFWLGVGALVIGALWLLSGPVAGIFGATQLRDLAIPLVLIAFGFALWRAGDRSQASANPPRDTTPAPGSAPSSQPSTTTPARQETTMPLASDHPSDTDVRPAAAPHSTQDTVRLDTSDTPGEQPPVQPPGPPPTAEGSGDGGWTPPPVEQRPPSLLARITIGLALVVTGVLWSLRIADVATIPTVRILAAALLVVGLGLLVGSVVGRGRSLLIVGAVLVPIVLVAETARPFVVNDLRFDTTARGAGEVRMAPSTPDELDPDHELGAGSIELDLSDLELDGDTVMTDVRVGAGEIVVLVPEGMGVEVEARTGIGQVELELGGTTRQGGGFGVNREMSAAPDPGEGTVELDLAAGMGQIEVHTAPDALGVGEPLALVAHH